MIVENNAPRVRLKVRFSWFWGAIVFTVGAALAAIIAAKAAPTDTL